MERIAYSTRSKPKRLKQPAWQSIPDYLHRSFPSWTQPESLHPSHATIERYIDGEETAIGIISSWRGTYAN